MTNLIFWFWYDRRRLEPSLVLVNMLGSRVDVMVLQWELNFDRLACAGLR